PARPRSGLRRDARAEAVDRNRREHVPEEGGAVPASLLTSIAVSFSFANQRGQAAPGSAQRRTTRWNWACASGGGTRAPGVHARWTSASIDFPPFLRESLSALQSALSDSPSQPMLKGARRQFGAPGTAPSATLVV